MKLAFWASVLFIATSSVCEDGICEGESDEVSLLQMRPQRQETEGSRRRRRTEDTEPRPTVIEVVPMAAPQPESAVQGSDGIYVSYMPVPSPPAPEPVPGRVMKFGANGAETVVDGLEGNAGLAINRKKDKLYVTSAGAVKEYSVGPNGAELTRTFDVSADMATTNGLCLSRDDRMLYVTEPGYALSPFGTVVKTNEHPTMLAIDLKRERVQVVFKDAQNQSPNGCVVHGRHPKDVHVINMQHGITRWTYSRRRKSWGQKPIRFARNLPGVQQKKTDQRAGDGLVYHRGSFYASLWKYNLTPEGAAVQTGEVYVCNPRKRACSVLANVAAADMQLGVVAQTKKPMLLLPDLIGGPVKGLTLS